MMALARARRLLQVWAALGTEGHAPRTVRRLAVINILSLMVALMTIPYILLYAVYDWRALLIPILTLSPQVPLYAVTPLWNRVHPYASAVYLLVVWIVFALIYSWYFGRDSGLHYYFLPGAAASMLICGPDKLRQSAAITAVALLGFVLAERRFLAPAPFLQVETGFVDLLFFLSAPFAFLLIFLTVLFAFTEATRAEDALERAHERSESLLGSLLPRSVADRLKAAPEAAVADALPSATILFADVVAFTPRAARLPPTELLAFLNGLFGQFDRLTAAQGLEKIKTVGDAYMVAGGLEGAGPGATGPTAPDPDVAAALRLARSMHDAAAGMRLGGQPVQLRIGIHTGPVLAGVIGAGRVAYDIWGDTVNLAARMEQTAPLGQTQVTAAVVAASASGAEGSAIGFLSRGMTEVKGYGAIETWLVTDTAGAG
jgi:class 3 adenylate cyclase